MIKFASTTTANHSAVLREHTVPHALLMVSGRRCRDVCGFHQNFCKSFRNETGSQPCRTASSCHAMNSAESDCRVAFAISRLLVFISGTFLTVFLTERNAAVHESAVKARSTFARTVRRSSWRSLAAFSKLFVWLYAILQYSDNSSSAVRLSD